MKDIVAWPVSISDEAKVRLLVIYQETGRTIADLIASAAEEEALKYFRHRSDDPGRSS